MKTERILVIADGALFQNKIKAQSATRVEGKGRHFTHRGILIALAVFLLILFAIRVSQSQEPFSKLKHPIPRIGGQESCWQFPNLALTEEQTKALEVLQHDYTAEAMPLRRELLPLRVELRHLIRDPNIPSKVLLDRQKRILELRMKLDSLSFSYQMKARSIFTQEQIERLPEDCLPGIGKEYEMMMGIGRRERRGSR